MKRPKENRPVILFNKYSHIYKFYNILLRRYVTSIYINNTYGQNSIYEYIYKTRSSDNSIILFHTIVWILEDKFMGISLYIKSRRQVRKFYYFRTF